MFIPLSVTNTAEVARAIADTSRTLAKPVLATFFGVPALPSCWRRYPATVS